MLNNAQKLTILGAIALFVCLLFGFSTKPKKLLETEKIRALNSSSTDISIIKKESLAQLSSDDRATIQILESKVKESTDTLERIELMKELSGKWFSLNEYALAGNKAEEIAEIVQTGESWAIAGTSYVRGIDQTESPKKSAFCKENAIKAMENAISLEPNNIEYQLNRGILFSNYPDEQNPMKGIQVLLKLNKNYPENVPVMNNLAKFAIQTNQLDKAKIRLTKALENEPNNRMSNCLAMDLYQRLGEPTKAELFRQKCEQKI